MYQSSIKCYSYQVFKDPMSRNDFLPHESGIHKLTFLSIHSLTFFSPNNACGGILNFVLQFGCNLTCFVWNRFWIYQHWWKWLQNWVRNQFFCPETMSILSLNMPCMTSGSSKMMIIYDQFKTANKRKNQFSSALPKMMVWTNYQDNKKKKNINMDCYKYIDKTFIPTSTKAVN